MWICPKCGEKHEAVFDTCWNCGSDRDGNPSADFEPLSANPQSGAADPEDDNSEPAEQPEDASNLDAAENAPDLDPCDHNDLVAVASFLHPAQAWIARNALVAAGIPATVVDEHVPGMYWPFAQAIGGVKVLVWPTDFAKAEAFLAKDRSICFPPAEETDPGVICPVCKSPDLCGDRYWRRGVFLMWLIFGFPIPIRLNTVRCLRCGYRERLPFSVPKRFTFRHLLILAFIVAVGLSIAKILGVDWLGPLTEAVTPHVR